MESSVLRYAVSSLLFTESIWSGFRLNKLRANGPQTRLWKTTNVTANPPVGKPVKIASAKILWLPGWLAAQIRQIAPGTKFPIYR